MDCYVSNLDASCLNEIMKSPCGSVLGKNSIYSYDLLIWLCFFFSDSPPELINMQRCSFFNTRTTNFFSQWNHVCVFITLHLSDISFYHHKLEVGFTTLLVAFRQISIVFHRSSTLVQCCLPSIINSDTLVSGGVPLRLQQVEKHFVAHSRSTTLANHEASSGSLSSLQLCTL